jgi:hypothetical protein
MAERQVAEQALLVSEQRYQSLLASTTDYVYMHTLKLICRTLLHLVKQAARLPQSVGFAVQQRRRQIALQELEAERLDRLRNPSKYQGR